MRTTSLEAYEAIRASGVLGDRTWQTYDTLFRHGPLTQAECWRRLAGGQLPQRSITPRFAQLLRMGFVRYLTNDDGSVAKRKCGVSGKLCMVWDVTTAASASEAKLPVSRLARATEHIRRLERRVEELLSLIHI
jgi:hypothetical protein